MCRGGLAHRLTIDHRPDRKDEQQRIRAAGGGVFQIAGIWRCTSAAGAARAMDARVRSRPRTWGTATPCTFLSVHC